jgi:hypothetical protein
MPTFQQRLQARHRRLNHWRRPARGPLYMTTKVGLSSLTLHLHGASQYGTGMTTSLRVGKSSLILHLHGACARPVQTQRTTTMSEQAETETWKDSQRRQTAVRTPVATPTRDPLKCHPQWVRLRHLWVSPRQHHSHRFLRHLPSLLPLP